MKDDKKKKKKKKKTQLPIHMGIGCAWREKRKRCAKPFVDAGDMCEEHTGKLCALCGGVATHPCRPKGAECSRFACDTCLSCSAEHGAAIMDEPPEAVEYASKEPRLGLLSENDSLRLRFAMRMHADMQLQRIACNNRGMPKAGRISAQLDERDRRFLLKSSHGLKKVESWALFEAAEIASHHPMWEWLRAVKGIGPMLACFLLDEFNPHRAERPSSFWKYAGLHVEDGRDPHPRKGEKLQWNKRVKSKVLEVLGGALLKAGNPDYRPIYDKAKAQKLAQIGPCMACDGMGIILASDKRGETAADAAKRTQENADLLKEYAEADAETRKSMACWNCEGEKTAPWGRGAKHRHRHANRLMVKEFMLDFWKEWRWTCGLPVVPPYSQRGPSGDHPHGGRYGVLRDGSKYTGPAYPDKDGNW